MVMKMMFTFPMIGVVSCLKLHSLLSVIFKKNYFKHSDTATFYNEVRDYYLKQNYLHWRCCKF